MNDDDTRPIVWPPSPTLPKPEPVVFSCWLVSYWAY